jgi:hypothetical protein
MNIHSIERVFISSFQAYLQEMTNMTAQTTQRLAQIAVTVQFLALVRTLLEFFRLKNLEGSSFTPVLAEPYVLGGVIAATCTWLGVTAYMLHRYLVTALIGAGTVLVLIVFKMLYVQ